MGYLDPDEEQRTRRGAISAGIGSVDYSTTAGAAAPAPAAPAPGGTLSSFYGDPASGVQIPTNNPPQNDAVAPLRPLDAINNFFRSDSPSAQSYRADQGIGVSLAPMRADPVLAINPQYTALSQTPLSDALGAAPAASGGVIEGGLYNNPREADYARQNAAFRAKDEQDFLDRRTRMAAGGDAANATQDLTRLQGEQRVARFNAENARLDVAGNIGGEGRYAAADKAQQAAAGVDADVAGAQGRYAAATARGNAPRNVIDEYVRQQQGLETAGRAATAGQKGALDVQGAQLDVETKKQLVALRSQLAAETDPAKRRALQDKLLAMQGHAPQNDRVAVVDVDTGQKDMLGQPIYKKAAVNTTTGELIGGDTAAPRAGPQKPASLDDAHKQAKAAIAAGAPLEQVNKRLKEWGYATL